MKQVVLLALFLLGISKIWTQNLENVGWLHRSDMIIGNDVLRLGVKEVYREGQMQYCFFLKNTKNITESFDIQASDFIQGDYLEKLFITQLELSYKKLEDSEKMRSSIPMTIELSCRSAIDQEGEVRLEDRLRFGTALDSVAVFYNKGQVDTLIEHLTALVDSNSKKANKNWVEDKIISIQNISKSHDNNIKKAIETGGRNFLNAVLDILQKRLYEGSKVGMLYVTDNAPIQFDPYFKHIKVGTFKDTTLNIKELEMKFEAGQIAGVAIKGTIYGYGDKIFTFHNRTPISFSTKFDVSFDYQVIRSIRVYGKDKLLYGYYVYLNEMLYNDYHLSNYTNNFSPIDTVIVLRPFEPGKVIFRERVTDILQARVYSDFIGYGNDQPNGLVQVEFSKMINLKTNIRNNREKDEPCIKDTSSKHLKNINDCFCKIASFKHTIKEIRMEHFNRGYRRLHTYEWFRYTTPMVSITKIEKNNKYLEITLNSDSNGLVRAVDLLQYANFKAGTQHNILRMSRPEFHSTFTLDMGLYMMLTGLTNNTISRDTTTGSSGDTVFLNRNVTARNALSFNFSPLILSWNLYPHSDYHLSFDYKMQHIAEFNSGIDFGPSEKGKGQWVNQLGMFGGMRTGELGNGEVFVRVLVNWRLGDRGQRFYQAQVGYSFKVFSHKREFKNRPIFN